jgi:hypothetical protein
LVITSEAEAQSAYHVPGASVRVGKINLGHASNCRVVPLSSQRAMTGLTVKISEDVTESVVSGKGAPGGGDTVEIEI